MKKFYERKEQKKNHFCRFPCSLPGLEMYDRRKKSLLIHACYVTPHNIKRYYYLACLIANIQFDRHNVFDKYDSSRFSTGFIRAFILDDFTLSEVTRLLTDLFVSRRKDLRVPDSSIQRVLQRTCFRHSIATTRVSKPVLP